MSFFSKVTTWFKNLFSKRSPTPAPVAVAPESTQVVAPIVKLEPEAELPKGLWVGPLKRPAEDTPGWEEYEYTIPMIGVFKNTRWRNPANGKVEWLDYPPQQPASLDWYYISWGHQDVGAPIWNAMAVTAEMIDEAKGPVGMERIRNYKGTLRSNPAYWPEGARKAYFEKHPA